VPCPEQSRWRTGTAPPGACSTASMSWSVYSTPYVAPAPPSSETLDAGADAIFPEALTTAEMFCEFARRMPGVKLLANMTEFGRTPFFTAAEFEEMGYAMVIWPVSHLRVAARAMEELYAAIRRDGGTQNAVDRMQTRAELYATIDYAAYEALDATLVKTVVPEAMPQRS